MPDFWMDVDAALSEVPVNILPLIDDTDFKSREVAIAYNAAGMDLVWNFVTTAGAFTQTAVTPTTAGDYDWTHQGDGMYTIEITASGGASINNDTEGFGWFSGFVTGVLPWRGPTIGFRAAALNNALIDGGDLLDVSVTQIGGDAQSATDLKDFADAGYDPATNKVQGVVLTDTTTTNTDLVTAAAVRTEIDSNSTQLAAIVADTNELQTDDVPGLIAALNDVSTAEVNTQVDTALSDIGLDHLVSASVTGTDVTDDSIIATMVSKSATADWDSFVNTTDALEAIRDNQAGADAAAIADAVWDEAKADHTGTATFGDLATDLDSVLTDTADMQPKLGSPAADVSADIAAVKVDTAATLVDTNELQGDWTNGGRLDLIIDAILADTGTDGVAISATVQNAIADAMLTRSASNVEDDGNTHNLAELILAAFESSLSGTTWTIKKTDGSTTYSTRTITTDADADPITAVT